jgi:gamma-glutamyltranspeptidase
LMSILYLCLYPGGNITLADLQGYEPAIKEPLAVTLKNGGYTLYNGRPPASGAIISFIMSILDGW